MPFSNTNKWRKINYTLLAPIYDPLARVFAKQRARVAEIAALQPGERILLLGAGTGLDLDHLPAGPRYTAIDLTASMLARLKKRASRRGLEVEAHVMDAMQLTFPDAAFDVALINLLLSVVPNPQRCLAEAARVVRPGGRAILFDKFAPASPATLSVLRLLNPIASLLGTNIDRPLAPMLEGTPWRVRCGESRGARGVYRIVTLERAAD